MYNGNGKLISIQTDGNGKKIIPFPNRTRKTDERQLCMPLIEDQYVLNALMHALDGNHIQTAALLWKNGAR